MELGLSLQEHLKITLNTSIPEPKRPAVEALVRRYTQDAQIIWLPSRFPRLVMLIEPSAASTSEARSGSMFESPVSGSASMQSVTAYLEEQIQKLLA